MLTRRFITFSILLTLFVLSFSLKANKEPLIRLESGAVYLQSLPGDFSRAWKICPVSGVASEGLQSQCVPITKAGLKDFSSEGKVILRSSFVLDPAFSNELIGIKIRELKGADEVYLNGSLIGKSGSFPPRYENAFFYDRHYLLNPKKIYFNRPNELELRVYHPNNNQFLIHLNSELSLHEEIQSSVLKSEILWSLAIGTLAFIVILKMYYFFNIKSNGDTLALAAFALMTGFYMMFNLNQVIGLNFDSNSLLRWKVVALIFSQFALCIYALIHLDVNHLILKRVLYTLYITLGISILVWPNTLILESGLFITKLLGIVIFTLLFVLIRWTRRETLSRSQKALTFLSIFYVLTIVIEMLRGTLIKLFYVGESVIIMLGAMATVIGLTVISTEHYWQYFKGATYDHLTGSLLRPTFLRRLSEEMQRCRRSNLTLLVAVIDIDQFKMINQNYGNELGDKALVLISATLNKALRQFDLISRLTDDEFCIAATLPADADTEVFLQRLHEEINSVSLTSEDNIEVQLKATTGAVIYSSKRHEIPDMLIHDAEHAVTEAKIRKRGSTHWFDTENPPLQFVF